jgi:hypothetical protein
MITDDTTTHGEVGDRCVKCGAKVLTACPTCGHRIRGDYHVPGVVAIGFETPRPDFCDNCGAAFPWVDRAGRIHELENRLDDEDLDPATELIVREQLEALVDAEMDEKEAARRWKRVRELAPGLWEQSGARRIIETLATEYVKRQLGLNEPGA